MARELEGRRVDFGPRTVADHIADWAAKTPAAMAVEAADRCLSYHELNARANRLARRLAQEGVGAGSVVALELSRSADLVMAILGVWRAGAAYLPLEPEWPADRRAALLADAKPVAIVTTADRARTDGSAWREVVLADVDLEAGGEHGSVGPALGDLAYVLYTSGSTGAPKGVAVEHGQLLNYVAAATAAMGLDRCRRWALTSSVAADLGNTALFGALFNGACLVVATADEATNPAAFARFVAERRIDAVKMTPSHLDALLEAQASRLPDTLVLGGEPASRSLIERIRRVSPECRIYNHYGPTETTVGVMVHPVSDGPSIPDVQPLTEVLANNRLCVLDDNLQPVPTGGTGEVYVGGAQVCRGYVNRQADGALVPDPFAPGERLYRTGDLACVLPGGGIRWVGRVDHQVKIRGFRVDPAEVESALATQPGVRQAVVLSVQRPDGPVELVACVVADSDAVPDVVMKSARERLRELLPEHMVPSRWTAMEPFARLPNGKVDRVGLTAPQHTTDAAEPHAPTSDLEALLAKGIETLLGRGTVGADENIFDLGVHSLLVIKLVARIRRTLEIEIAPGFVFDHPTVADLANALRLKAGDTSRLEAMAKAALPSIAAAAPRAMAAPGVP